MYVQPLCMHIGHLPLGLDRDCSHIWFLGPKVNAWSLVRGASTVVCISVTVSLYLTEYTYGTWDPRSQTEACGKVECGRQCGPPFVYLCIRPRIFRACYSQLTQATDKSNKPLDSPLHEPLRTWNRISRLMYCHCMFSAFLAVPEWNVLRLRLVPRQNHASQCWCMQVLRANQLLVGSEWTNQWTRLIFTFQNAKQKLDFQQWPHPLGWSLCLLQLHTLHWYSNESRLKCKLARLFFVITARRWV